MSADLSSADLSDGDLARLARGGDPMAFRLLVERHQAMVRARARQLAPDPGDVDDIAQESFLQAFLALDRLRDPDRFAGWLAGIVFNVCRSLHRRAPVTLLADWPEPLHPTSAGGLPSPEDLDRADALRAAVAGLPAGQRRAVTLHYYADVPAGQVAEAPGAARASLYKARLRLRAYLTEHRPDLVPERTHMTTVRVARIERRIPPGPVPDRFPTHVMVLADDAGRRDLPIWLLGQDSHRFADDARSGPSSDELTDRLLRAAGARVTAVDVDELGPEVTVARIELATPAGPEHVTARLLDGLAAAIISGAPIRVADAVMDRMALPAEAESAGTEPARTGPARTSQGRPMPQQTARDLSIGQRPRYEPRNLTFAAGLDHWVLGGSFTENPLQSVWNDYEAAADHGTAVLSAAVPQPEGFAWLAQEIFADDYRGATVTLRGEFRAPQGAGRAGLFLRVMQPQDARGPVTAEAALADPANHIVTVEGPGDWTTYEVTAPVPDDANTVAFGVFLVGSGRIELRDPELTREN
ncbi:MAG TPA: bifunctional nuclease domain-containing protein [Streptosporangiaceae bacterium]|nr:bifunctional nuclease domain-containing protein [Streptosporangiaceae bacterium]